MSFRHSHPLALVQVVFKLWFVMRASASSESYLSFPQVGIQKPEIPSDPFTAFLALAKLDTNKPHDEEESPFQSRRYVYDHLKVNEIAVAPSAENPSLGGFTKQRCYPNLDPLEEDYCVYANPSFANDRGMVLYIRPSRLIEKLDSFTIFEEGSGLLTDEERKKLPYKLLHMPTKGGLGAVAQRKLNIGDLVVVDYSLVVITSDIAEITLSEWGPRFKYMVDLLPLKGRELFAKQHGVGDDEISWIISAFKRNVFAAPQDDDESGGCAFAPEPAVNLNHDCRPNVSYRFNNETLQVEMRALREIAPGEELTISYIKLMQTREERQETLHDSYGFNCSCAQCSLSDADSDASDSRITEIIDLWEEVSDWEANPPPSPAQAETLIELFKAERMDVVMEEPYTMASLVFNSWGLTHEARKYAALAVSYGAYTHDRAWLDTSSHLTLIYNPEAHWSYNFRKNMDAAGKRPEEDAIHSHDEL